jgi:DNA-binding phage protein
MPNLPGMAHQAGLNATTLYRTLSGNGNPGLRTLRALLGAIGLRLFIAPAAQPRLGTRNSRLGFPAAPSR